MKFVARSRKSRQMQGKGLVVCAAYWLYVSKDGGFFDDADDRLTDPQQITRE